MLCTHGRRGTNKGMGWAGLGARDKGSSSRQADTAHAFMQGGEEGRRRGAASGLSFPPWPIVPISYGLDLVRRKGGVFIT